MDIFISSLLFYPLSVLSVPKADTDYLFVHLHSNRSTGGEVSLDIHPPELEGASKSPKTAGGGIGASYLDFLELSNLPYSACPRECPAINSPVCGLNGKTYGSKCLLRRDACKLDKAIMILHRGRCKERRRCSNCVFPFTFRGVKINACTTIDGDAKPWCSTRVDRRGVHVGGGGHYQYCEECPIIKDCNKPCPRDCPQVCGSNGKTYCNYCVLENDACKTGQKITIKHNGRCKDCIKPCTRDCPKVCGSNGKTYCNTCVLENEACETGKKITIEYYGECKDCNKPCTRDCPQVCGSNGKTYCNKCVLENEACDTGNKITVKHDGRCKECDKPCTRDCPQVCGSNGKTYCNKCILQNDACKIGRKITVKHDGKCKGCPVKQPSLGGSCSIPMTCSFGKECCCGKCHPSFKTQCSGGHWVGYYTDACMRPNCRGSQESGEHTECREDCPRIYHPVCGSDGRTYGNKCELKREACTSGKPIRIIHWGRCKECREGCPRIYHPVCGSDGKTYGNKCELRREACTSGKPIRIRHWGRCKECRIACTREYQPVCGTNGVTYSNKCELEAEACMHQTPVCTKLSCSRMRQPGLTIRHPGRCRWGG